MTTFRVGDAVMTPDGHPGTVDRIGRSFFGGEEGAVVTHAECPDGERFWLHRLTRLVPDTGLEERVRSLVEHAEAIAVDDCATELWVRAVDLETALDTQEAEPEPPPARGGGVMRLTRRKGRRWYDHGPDWPYLLALFSAGLVVGYSLGHAT